MIKKCEFCGKEFECKNSRKLTCSKLCKSRRDASINMTKLICRHCGKEFYNKDKNRKFCSHECYSKNKKQLENRTCECCGNEYIANSNRDNLRFCSRKCYDKWHYESSILIYKCEYCDIEFKKEGKKNFNYIDGKKIIPRYCSKECVDKARIGKYRRENSSTWKGGVCLINDLVRSELKYWKKDIMKCADYICFVSGERGGELVVHHIKPFHLIRDEILNKFGLDGKSCISECNTEIHDKIMEDFKKAHTINSGVPIKKELHKQFHKIYGFKTTYNDLLKFKKRYENGEFKEEISCLECS